MIKYQYCLDSHQNTINIQNLSKQNREGIFTCLGCGHEMVPVLGEKRVKHFRHKVVKEINCSPETYLHKLAKNKFYEIYQDCLNNDKPFKIRILTYPICNFYKDDFLVTCQLSDKLEEFELTKFFKKIYLESKEDSFIPDVLLEANNQEKIFFEVVVTHTSSQEKINSKYRIIEFFISSEEEIKNIESCVLQESNKIHFMNFKRQPQGKWCNGKCLNEIIPYASDILLHNAFVIYKNGKSAFIRESLDHIESIQSKLLHFEHISLKEHSDIGSFYKYKIVEAFQKGLKFKNCFLCRYHAQNQSWNSSGAVFCKFLKKAGNSNMATDCQYFKPDAQVFSQYEYAKPSNIQEEFHIEEDADGYF